MAFIQRAEIEVRPNASEFEKATIEMLNDLAKDPIILAGAAGLGVSLGRKIADALFIFAVQKLAEKALDAYDQFIEDFNKRRQNLDPPFEKVEVLDRDEQAILEMTEKHLQSQKENVIALAKEYGFLDEKTESAWKSVKFVGENLQDTTVQVEKAEKAIGNQRKEIVATSEAAKVAEKSYEEYVNQNQELLEKNRSLPGALNETAEAVENVGDGAEKAKEKIDAVGNSGGIFDDLKKGAEDFFKSLQTTGELTANFVTETFGQIRNTISDLFFNVLKGNFDDLGDIAKQAFNSILNSFLQLVSNIAANKLVLSIGGLFGLGTSATAAGGAGSKEVKAERPEELLNKEEMEYRLAA